ESKGCPLGLPPPLPAGTAPPEPPDPPHAAIAVKLAIASAFRIIVKFMTDRSGLEWEEVRRTDADLQLKLRRFQAADDRTAVLRRDRQTFDRGNVIGSEVRGVAAVEHQLHETVFCKPLRHAEEVGD